MPRTHARIKTSIWSDEDFRALSLESQWLYQMLLSQPDLTQAGTLPLTLRRWSRYSSGTLPEDIEKPLGELEAERFVIVDHDVEELLVRTLMRNDEVWKQPNVMASAAKAIALVSSPLLRKAIREELILISQNDLGTLHTSRGRSVKDIVAALIEGLSEPFEEPQERANERAISGVDGDTLLTDSAERSPLSPFPIETSEIGTLPETLREGDDESGPNREDVERLCRHLAERITANGSKAPVITAKWRDAARLMLDRDGRTEQQIRNAIDWCQDDEFWRGNVLSMPTLRKQYDRLRLAAQRGHQRQDDTDELLQRAAIRLAAKEVG